MNEDEIERILANCRRNLEFEVERAVTTGVGVFAFMAHPSRGVLLVVRQEKDSLLRKNLQGRLEPAGGGVDFIDFPQESNNFQKAAINTLVKEIWEETGLEWSPDHSSPLFLLPSWLYNPDAGIVDMAFVTIINWEDIIETKEFEKKLSAGEIVFVSMELLKDGKYDSEIVSRQICFLIKNSIKALTNEK